MKRLSEVDLFPVVLISGIVLVSVGLGLGLVSLRHTISRKRLEHVGVEVIETEFLGRPTKVVDINGDTCVVVPGMSFVKINK